MRRVLQVERKLQESQQQLLATEEENANMRMELEARPSVREWRGARRRIDKLERSLVAARDGIKEAQGDEEKIRNYLSTQELVKRDRADHRLRLHRVDGLPVGVCRDLVKNVCRVLDIGDVSLIESSMDKLVAVVKAVPRMEVFIRDVCHLVYVHTSSSSASDSAHRMAAADGGGARGFDRGVGAGAYGVHGDSTGLAQDGDGRPNPVGGTAVSPDAVVPTMKKWLARYVGGWVGGWVNTGGGW